MKVIFLFVDGVGMSTPSADNPLNPEVCPTVYRLISEHGQPIDACLGMVGLPQSATGQGTMFTGLNCSEAMGRHCEGFPPLALRRLIEEDNLFKQLQRRKRKVKFADAYLLNGADELAATRFKSVTTVMALTTPEVLSFVDDLERDDALVQDITRDAIQDRYPDIPTIAPERAAEQLFKIARQNDFTLFEFFQTDVAGHSMDYTRACNVLRLYDRFLSTLTSYTEAAGITIVLTADHGNIESISTRGHTRNPVPFAAFGPGEKFLRERVSSLIDVTPALLAAYDTF